MDYLYNQMLYSMLADRARDEWEQIANEINDREVYDRNSQNS